MQFQISVVFVSCAALICCAQRDNVKVYPRIVDGVGVLGSEYPYMVSVRVQDVFVCGGSLITSQCVLTAAHCLQFSSPHDISVRGGSTKLFGDGVTRRVKCTFMPRTYDKYTLDADVAILKLDRCIQGANIQSITIKYEEVLQPMEILVLGWGETKHHESPSHKELRAVNLTVVGREKCQHFYPRPYQITRNMFCGQGAHGKDSCQGDSGGPAVYRGKQVGIVSWGLSCGDEKFPGIYTNLSSPEVSEFIKETIKRYC